MTQELIVQNTTPIPVDQPEEPTYTLDVAGVVESEHSTVAGEGETWRIEIV